MIIDVTAARREPAIAAVKASPACCVVKLYTVPKTTGMVMKKEKMTAKLKPR